MALHFIADLGLLIGLLPGSSVCDLSFQFLILHLLISVHSTTIHFLALFF